MRSIKIMLLGVLGVCGSILAAQADLKGKSTFGKSVDDPGTGLKQTKKMDRPLKKGEAYPPVCVDTGKVTHRLEDPGYKNCLLEQEKTAPAELPVKPLPKDGKKIDHHSY